MALRADRTGSRPPAPPTGTVRGYYTGRERPVGGYELWAWLFMRISGILLLVLAVGHVLIMHVVGGGVGRVNFGFVALRWRHPFWRTWDWMMLSLALLHGVNGLRTVIMDYVRRPTARFAMTWCFTVVGLVMFALGTVVVFSFDPNNFPLTK
jgi:succinate dehydrogenase / fumarate reductase membrane anchor subunit